MDKSKTKILCIGEEWKGSNASGLFYALSRIGCVTVVVNELRFISLSATQFQAKIVNRLVRSVQIKDFNASLIRVTNSFKPDVILVYKGAFIKPTTIRFWRKTSIPVVNFFPDVSFMAHGSLIPAGIKLYDHIMTTKSFAAADLYKNFGYPKEKVTFIPHGYDPLTHQHWYNENVDSNFQCDASFIGNYTKMKEEYLAFLVDGCPMEDIRIWGNGWFRADSPKAIVKAYQGVPIIGDLYSYGISRSKINIALLSEQVKGASSGDLITSRTFHITGSGGFMLHQRNDEVIKYFEEDKEMACFSTKEELGDKVKYYLSHEKERVQIQQAGHKRAVNEHSLDKRALMIMGILQEKGLVK